jgi:hypothetical protein
MRYARENVMSPEELASEFHLSEARLADLRSEHKGPPYFELGGIWYPKNAFDEWAEEQLNKGAEVVAKEEERQVVLPVRSARTGEQGKHRFGRHVTKQGVGAGDRIVRAESSEDREASVASTGHGTLRCLRPTDVSEPLDAGRMPPRLTSTSRHGFKQLARKQTVTIEPEQNYSPSEVAAALNLSYDAALRLMPKMKGVVDFGTPTRRYKRGKKKLRISGKNLLAFLRSKTIN